MPTWKDLDYLGFSRYSLSSRGKLKNRYGKIMDGEDCSGYIRYSLKNDDGETIRYLGHVLVALVFIGPNEDEYVVNHINHDKKDNRVKNLKYVTQSQNLKHFHKEIGCERSGKKVIQYDIEGNKIKTWKTMSRAARKLGLHVGNIARACDGRYKQCGGYKWEYGDEEIEIEDEEWKSLVINEKKIKVSTYGRVRMVNKTITYGRANANGYMQVKVNRKYFMVHRLVYMTFEGEIPDGYSIDHIDRKRDNNEISNLRLATQKEQSANRRKVTTRKGRPINQLDDDGEIIKTFQSAREAERELGINNANICAVCKGKLNMAGGYGWEYAE